MEQPVRAKEEACVAQFLSEFGPQIPGADVEWWEERAGSDSYPLVVYHYLRPGSRIDVVGRERRILNVVFEVRAISHGMGIWRADEIAEAFDTAFEQILYRPAPYGFTIDQITQVTPVRNSIRGSTQDAASSELYRYRGGDYEFRVSRN